MNTIKAAILALLWLAPGALAQSITSGVCSVCPVSQFSGVIADNPPIAGNGTPGSPLFLDPSSVTLQGNGVNIAQLEADFLALEISADAQFAQIAAGTTTIAGDLSAHEAAADAQFTQIAADTTTIAGVLSAHEATADAQFTQIAADTTTLNSTKVNRAGDTITGQLRIQNGSEAAPSIRSMSGNSGMYFPVGAAHIGFSQNDTEDFRISPGGPQISNNAFYYFSGIGNFQYGIGRVGNESVIRVGSFNVLFVGNSQFRLTRNTVITGDGTTGLTVNSGKINGDGSGLFNVGASTAASITISSAASDGATLTTSTTYVEKLSSTHTVETGTYLITWSAELSNNANNRQTCYRVQLNDTDTLAEACPAFQLITSTPYLPVSGSYVATTAAGTINLNMDLRIESTGTGELRRSRFIVQKVVIQ